MARNPGRSIVSELPLFWRPQLKYVIGAIDTGDSSMNHVLYDFRNIIASED